MRKRSWCSTQALAFALVLAFPAASQGVAKEPTADATKTDTMLVTNIDAWIVIDEQGNPADFGIDTKVPEQVRVGLDRTARRWKFEPVLIDGVARRAKTAVRITLAAHGRDSEGYRVTVDNVLFPANAAKRKADAATSGKELTAKRLTPPRYPKELLRAGVSGTVMLALRVNPDGSVAEALPVQTSLFDVRANQKTASRAIALLEKASIAAAREWQVSVGANASSRRPEDLTVMVPITYMIGTSPTPSQDGLWRQEIRGEKRVIDWLPADAKRQSAGSSDLRNGEMYPVASDFRFVEDVRGQVL